MSRVFRPISLLILLALLVTSCASQPAQPAEEEEAPGEAAAGEPVVLSFSNWQWTETGKNDQWRELFARFQEEHPNVELEEVAVPYDRYEDTLYTRWAGGEGPDLVVFNDSMIAKAVEFGHLQPLGELIDLDQYQDQFSGLQELAVRDGQTYGFVTEGVVYETIYNPELFQQVGLDSNTPPQTLDEFLDACVKISELGPDILGYGVRNSLDQSGGWWYDYSAWIYGYGGRWAIDGQPTVNSAENLAALEAFKRVYDSGCMSQGLPSATYRKAFGLGKVGMLTDVSAMINIYKNENPELEVMTAPLPFPEPVTAAEVLFVGISTDAEHPEAAAMFIEWFMQPEVYQTWLETILSPTGGLKEGVSDEWLEANAWAMPFIEGANQGALGVTPEGLEAFTNEFSKIVLTEIEAVLVADQDPQEALDAAQAEVQAMLERNQ